MCTFCVWQQMNLNIEVNIWTTLLWVCMCTQISVDHMNFLHTLKNMIDIYIVHEAQASHCSKILPNRWIKVDIFSYNKSPRQKQRPKNSWQLIGWPPFVSKNSRSLYRWCLFMVWAFQRLIFSKLRTWLLSTLVKSSTRGISQIWL